MISIREVREEDNAALGTAIRQVLIDIGVPKVGTAYADPELDFMFQAYQKERSAYFIIAEEDVVLGGAGIAPLAGEDPRICELQKMYFLMQARGKGWGQKMINHCLAYAKTQNFELCYLETLPYMQAAQKLYLKTGFDYIEGPMGNTGHTSCNVWLTKAL